MEDFYGGVRSGEMIYTSYFAAAKRLDKDVSPIAICRTVPKGYKGEQYIALAPSYDILREYKETGDRENFTQRFYSEILDKLDPFEVIKHLNSLASPWVRDRTFEMGEAVAFNPLYHVALLCYEKSYDFCHRHLVAEWLRSHWIECSEL